MKVNHTKKIVTLEVNEVRSAIDAYLVAHGVHCTINGINFETGEVFVETVTDDREPVLTNDRPTKGMTFRPLTTITDEQIAQLRNERQIAAITEFHTHSRNDTVRERARTACITIWNKIYGGALQEDA